MLHGSGARARVRHAGIWSSPTGMYFFALPCESNCATRVPFEHTAGCVVSALLLQRKCKPPLPGSTVHSIFLVASLSAVDVGSPLRPLFAAANAATAMYIAAP